MISVTAGLLLTVVLPIWWTQTQPHPPAVEEITIFRQPATAVLLPDYTWHVVDPPVVDIHTKKHFFCFTEFMGDKHVRTCGPADSLLGWRNPMSPQETP